MTIGKYQEKLNEKDLNAQVDNIIKPATCVKSFSEMPEIKKFLDRNGLFPYQDYRLSDLLNAICKELNDR